ncbi:MAG: heme ABC exporter ATP-binding protein CcmA [Gammaproteobacteria bacterium]|nr:heme ABC exporter ATP-binding protein CcmA [Gammaproteobacteria bacterium]
MSEVLLRAAGVGCEVDGMRLFHGLDLVVQGGEMVEVRGANASGKSTLLRCLAGLISPGSGAVEVRGDFAYVGHRLGLSDTLTARENLLWLLSLCASQLRRNELASRTDEALVRLGISATGGRTVASLSAGQRRRVALAGVLANPARLWLLDEPSTALDEVGVALLAAEMDRHLESGGGVVVATHRPLGPRPARTVQLGIT